MNGIKTADLVDTHDAEVRFCHWPLRLFGQRRFFHGTIATVKTFEDNVLLKNYLEQDGTGRVLVVDAGASTRVAVVGDMVAAIGQKSGWAGIVINGGIRDVAEIQAMDFGIYALGHSPKKSGKAGIGAVDVPVSFGGVDFVPGHFLYADEDGILVAARPVHEDAV
jgi:regulator of ribonuclease activity A